MHIQWSSAARARADRAAAGLVDTATIVRVAGMCCNFGGVGWWAETIVKHATRPTIFKWRQTAPELILCALRWYLRYSLSLRDVEELFAERGLEADHTTIWRWVQRYGPELERRLCRQLKPTNQSWRIDDSVGEHRRG